MKRGDGLKRTVPLKQTSGLRRTSKLAQQGGRESLSARGTTGKSAPKRKAVDVGPSAEVVEGVLSRENFSCALCGMGIGPEGRGIGWSIHHRLRRSQGVQHAIQNLLLLCGSGTTLCHGRVHAEPAAAREGGWMLSGRQEPLAVPVLIAGQRWVYLTATGLYTPIREAS